MSRNESPRLFGSTTEAIGLDSDMMISIDDKSFSSNSLLLYRSTSNCLLRRKSAPIMGQVTSATTNLQLNVRGKPISMLMTTSPSTLIFEPFAADKIFFDLNSTFLNCVEGRMEQEAPVSTKNLMFRFLSVTQKRWKSTEFIGKAALCHSESA